MKDLPFLWISPISKNVTDAAIEYCLNKGTKVGFIPSRRQVDFAGGYVNGWDTNTLAKYIRTRAPKLLCPIQRDHGGPNQGETVDDGLRSFRADAHFFDAIHIDPFNTVWSVEDIAAYTVFVIKMCWEINPNLRYEIGTEEAIYKYQDGDLAYLIEYCQSNLIGKQFGQIDYAVVQPGTKLLENNNVGVFNPESFEEQIKTCRNNGLLTKCHNGDWLTKRHIRGLYQLGLDAINIAPEFGQLESKILYDYLSPRSKAIFYDVSVNSGKWKKWVPKDFNPAKDKAKTVEICGHYSFSHPAVLSIKSTLPKIDEILKKEIKVKLDGFFEI